MPTVPFLGGYGDLSGSGLMFRNKLINGGFDIWQRATSQTANGYGSDDRWNNANVGSTKTTSQQTFTLGQTDVPGNPTYFSRTVVSSVAGASNYVVKIQKIEGVRTLAGQTVTLSFWAKADASKNIAFEFEQVFGTGGSPSATVAPIAPTTFNLTTSWKLFTLTTTLPSISGKVLGTSEDCLTCIFWLDAGSSYNSFTNSLGQQSGTFDLANVQLEAGPVATPFEQRPIGTELLLCQRYYEDLKAGGYIWSGNTTNASTYYLTYPFKVSKRRTPVAGNLTITHFNSLNFSTSPSTFASASTECVGVSRVANATGNGGYFADLVKVDVEL